jgi:hypothetical protein
LASEGEVILALQGRGGRHLQHHSPEKGAQVPALFVARATAGVMIKVAEFQRAYEQRGSKSVAPQTIYRLLEGHRWPKLGLRSRHPKARRAWQVDAISTWLLRLPGDPRKYAPPQSACGVLASAAISQSPSSSTASRSTSARTAVASSWLDSTRARPRPP